jgi:hypothetical protein
MTTVIEPPDDSDKDKDKDRDKDKKETVEEVLDGLGIPPEMINAIKTVEGAIAASQEEKKKKLDDLYGEEDFAETKNTFNEDLGAYDEPAYTRTAVDYNAYRYNLQSPKVAPPPGTATTYGSSSYGYGGGSYGDSWVSYGGGWSSSWYSGYRNVETAITGVHGHVSAFVTAAGFTSLEVVPDLENTSESAASGRGEKPEADKSDFRYRLYPTDQEKSLVVRIDSSLYEKLGIEVAQQHYIVDGIGQVLAAQQYPDPLLITLLQAKNKDNCPIANVVRELITEMMRVKGLELLLEEMPGWLQRVTAFRSAMYVGAPQRGQTIAAYLVYAAWERDTVETIEHEDAINVINSIEEALQRASEYTTKEYTMESGAILEHRYRKFLAVKREAILNDIVTIIVSYITSSSPAGVITSKLGSMKKIFQDKERSVENNIKRDKKADAEDPVFWGTVGAKEVEAECVAIQPLIHNHNRTFLPDPTVRRDVRHLDFPDCPSLALLPEPVKERVQFSRKCLFNLDMLPKEIKAICRMKDEPITRNLVRGIARIDDMLQGIQDSLSRFLEQANQEAEGRSGGASGGAGLGGYASGGRSHKVNKHEVFKARGPIRPASNSFYEGEDPDFASPVTIFDCTIGS